MTSTLRIALLGTLLGGTLLIGVAACKEEGPAERAGEAVDEAVEDVRDGAEEAAEDVSRGLDEAQEEARKAAERLKKSVDPEP